MKLQIGVDGKTYEVEVEVLEDDSSVRTPGYLPPHPVEPTTIPSVPVASAPKPPAESGGTVDEAVDFLRGTGMARRLFAEASHDEVARAIEAVRVALAPYQTPEGVRLGAAAWLVHAHR